MTPPAAAAGRFHDLGKRISSALVLGLLALGAVEAGGAWYCALIMVVALLLIFEWNRLASGDGFSRTAVFHGVAALAALGLTYRGAYGPAFAALAVGLVATVLAARPPGRPTVWALLALPYIGLPCMAMLWLRFMEPAGPELVYWLLVSIWAMDSGAYLAGRLIGGPRLAPRISPKKTWAGLVGGMVAAGLLGGGAAALAGLGHSLGLGLVGCVIGAWSQVGDICESAMKRHFGVKDSSGLIPGHGGFMDRLDGLLFAAPLAVLAVAAGVV